MAPVTQENRQLAIDVPSMEKKDVLVLASVSGSEDVAGLFSFQLRMLSLQDSIPAKDIVGKNVTFQVRLVDGKSFRYFNGYVSRFSAGSREGDLRWYQAEVVPWLWFLTQTADCRVFQGKSVPDIVKQIFDDSGFSGQYDDDEIKESHEKLEYCVQYRETAFNFVSRLMEQEGIFYYFRHEKGKHTLVLADKNKAFKDCPEKEVQFAYSYQEGATPETRLTSWNHEYTYTPGKWAQTDYNFVDTPAGTEKTPADLLKTPEKSTVQLDKNEKYEVFDYPGLYDLKSPGATSQDPDKKRIGKVFTEIRMQEDDLAYDVVQAGSNCRTFSAGGKFKVKKHEVSGQSPGGFPKADEDKSYLITSIQHSAIEPTLLGGSLSAGADYSNSFTCIPESVTYRPGRETSKPAIYGAQTAVVVGPKGSEINTDKYGRVQVQFFWDRYNSRLQDPPSGVDPKKQAKPVWIRVGQIIAGKHWGAMFIPRVGQEVIVTFLDGDPDRPLITGVVYNADQMPPYDPKEEPTKSYIKTNSSTGGEGYNELRFEDKKGKEQVFIHSQRNMDVRVRASSMESVGGNRHLIVGGEKDGKKSGDQFEMVFRDRHLKLHRNHTEQIGGDMQLLVGGIDGPGNQEIVIKAEKKELIEKNNHLHVKADRNEKVDGNQSLTVGGNQQEKVGMKHALDAGMEIHLKSGQKVVIEAGVQLTLKGPGGFVDISPAGVAIQGTMVLINSGGAPGVGSGSSPTAPADPPDVFPKEPTPADSHKTGQKSTPY